METVPEGVKTFSGIESPGQTWPLGNEVLPSAICLQVLWSHAQACLCWKQKTKNYPFGLLWQHTSPWTLHRLHALEVRMNLQVPGGGMVPREGIRGTSRKDPRTFECPCMHVNTAHGHKLTIPTGSRLIELNDEKVSNLKNFSQGRIMPCTIVENSL